MILNEDSKSAKLGDRLIAAVIGGLCGLLIGSAFAILVRFVSPSDYELSWIFASAFAIFAFIAPSKSTKIWSAFWEEILRFLSSRK